MPQPVIRLYESHPPAMEAAKALKEQGFPGDQIGLLSREANAGQADARQPTASDLMGAVKSVGISGTDAKHYADAVEQGGALLCVWPPYGRAGQAMQIMDGFAPVNSGAPHGGHTRHTAHEGRLIDEPAPLSRLLHIPVLLRD